MFSAGINGWYLSFDRGSPTLTEVWITQLPIQTYVILSIAYPANTEFSIQRIFKWYSNLNSIVQQTDTLQKVLQGNGNLYFFNNKHLYIKLVDPQYSSNNLIDGNLVVYGTRWWDYYYKIETNLGTGPFVPNNDPGPPASLVAYEGLARSFVNTTEFQHGNHIARECRDEHPTGKHWRCKEMPVTGQCRANYVMQGGYCALSCKTCPTM